MKPWMVVAAAAVGLGALVYLLTQRPAAASPDYNWPVLPSGPPSAEPSSGPFCR